MRRDHLAVAVSQVLYHLTEAGIVHIHLCHIDHTGKIILVAQFPCLLRSHFHAGLAGNHDHCRVRRADRFLYLAHEIKVSRGVQHIDLRLLPLDGHQRRADRKITLLLLFIKIADRVAVRNLAHPADRSRHVGHSLYKAGLSASSVSQQDHVSDLVRSVNFHIS